MSVARPPTVGAARTVVLLVLVVVVMPVLPVLISGDWGWWQAWAYAAVACLGFVLSRAVVARRHPDLIAERAGTFRHDDVKPWDLWLAPMMAFGSLLPPVLAAVERRWASPPALGLAANVAGLVLLVIGYLLGSLAMARNRFFSGQVRIQRDRGHQVVTGGPYRWVRHPGYAGSLLAHLGVPLLLDSTWAWLGVACLMAITVLRTSLEDRTLQQELPGYAEYAQRVHHRLVPGVW